MAPWRLLLLIPVLGALAGCDARPRTADFRLLRGVITGVDAQTGEITLAAVERRADAQPVTRFCHVTPHSEVFINDRLTDVRELRVGDQAEVMVMVSGDERMEQLAVVTATLQRDDDEAPDPPREPPPSHEAPTESAP
ncbi:MAG: hypothetical protein IPM64_10055 [Phycisphaerales bacterium]|nr:hypothetical protein [Phycisphaerales bacterium]